MTVRVATNGTGPAVSARLAAWDDDKFAARLWQRDPTIWFDPPRDGIAERLGWLDLPDEDRMARIRAIATSAATDSTDDIVLIGMGGSSLAPEVFASVLASGSPPLTILDSTHPDSIAAVSDSIDPARTLFIVASKSGKTLETLSLFRLMWDRTAKVVDKPGSRFIAITDPGSELAQLGEDRGFRAVVLAPADVGGRYSALTEFGLVPAALIGVDVERLVTGAREMAATCGPDIPASTSPAMQLAAALGEWAIAGRDKLVLEADPNVAALPGWIEQLVAESLGKDGTGILPIAAGSVSPAPDRVSLAIAVGREPSPAAPSAALILDDRYDIGAVMFLLEMAVAGAGAILGVNPFDQPDVELAKQLARTAMTDGVSSLQVTEWSLDDEDTADRLGELLGAAQPNGYVAIQAYLAPDEASRAELDRLAGTIAERTGAAVTIGFGPRFLHSTGQYHKGGTPSGLFLQIVDHPGADLAVPETDYTFAELIAAQSFGDQAALSDRSRPVAMVCLGDAGPSDLPRLTATMERVLQ
ncbi:MAG: hypothetical protein BMS9Abin07_1357 [Acidimicrobiia bacterium]|nr:MAG: hypothetical protein BMS9Abin07_1357 [Acidimicrobiia bacterium]